MPTVLVGFLLPSMWGISSRLLQQSAASSPYLGHGVASLGHCPRPRAWGSSALMKVKEESEKGGLKLNIQKTKIMASGPITSWQIDRERVETVATVADFIFLDSKSLQIVIAAMKLKDAYSLEEKL